jgi:hypothetical protein
MYTTASGLAGWLLVQHLEQFPSIDSIRGYDDNGDLRLMLGARVQRLGRILPAPVKAALKVLSRLGNLECHDNDTKHRLQDGQKLKVVKALLHLGRLTVAGSLDPCPKPVQKLCRNWAQQKECKNGQRCRFSHGAKCKFNNRCGGCQNDKCEFIHVALCNSEDCHLGRKCGFDHIHK